MKDLPAIARYMRLPEEQLRFPVELLHQGYEPNYLAAYRPDELGGVDVDTLAKLKRAVEYEAKLAAHKVRVQQGLERDQHWTETVSKVIAECSSISQTDAIARYLRGKKSAKGYAEINPNIEKLGQAILVMQSDPPTDLIAWVIEQTEVAPDQVDELLRQTKHWLQLLMCEDPQLILHLQRAVLRNANVSLQILPEPSKPIDTDPEDHAAPVTTEARLTAAPPAAPRSVATTLEETPVDGLSSEPSSSEHVAHTQPDNDSISSESSSSTTDHADVDVHPGVADEVAFESEPASTAIAPSDATASPAIHSVAASDSIPPSESESTKDTAVAPLIEQFHKGRKQSKGIKTKSLSDKQLSPRQRRRRWLRSIVESYAKLKKPLRALTPYQILMFSRGIRSQIIQLQFQQDLRPLVQACRESLCPGRHPMHPLLMEVAEMGLKEMILPRLHQDVMAILEEDSNQELIESSVLHLQSSLLQRPIRGHRVLLIDSVGQKTAAVAMIDADGNVLGTGELPCNSSKPDVVAQNVTLLGQWVHAHQITLVVLSNGHARRYLIHSVAELMKQSSEGSIYWSMTDRAGADAYCMSRTSLVELPRISRRHRSAVWLAWRLQDPLRQILKIDPARLRLGSYQRELPQQELETALHESISAAITKAGVDVFHAHVEVLKRIPGMTDEAAKRIDTERQQGTITNRDSLMRSLRESLPETQARQAIGFLRVFDSDNSLDGTIIHPDDYRLAQRLIAHAELPTPPAAPEGWAKPDYERIAAAHAAVASLALESTLSEEVDAYGFEASTVEINPKFGVLDETSVADPGAEDPSSDESSDIDGSNEPSTDAAAIPSEPAPADTPVDADAPAVQDSEAMASAETDSTVAPDDSPESASPSDEAATATERSASRMPEIALAPMAKPTLKVDAEKLARSWQVGRAKLMSVAASLQFPFADVRDFQFPVPIQCHVPRLDALPQGTMLTALVIGVADFGVFVELGPDCSGLIHISRLASEFVEDPHQFVQVGDVIPVWVLNVDEKRKRVALTAIAPGSEARRDSYRNEEDNRSSSGSRNPRGDRNAQSGRDDRSNNNRPATAGAPTGASNASGNSRPGGDRNRSAGGPANRGGPPGGRGGPGGNRGGAGGRGRDNRSRRDDDAGENESGNRRPVRIERPKPEKPITEAMQQGKEPLRSFGDLLQFIKQTKPTGPEEGATPNVKPTQPESIPTNNDAPSEAPVNTDGGPEQA
jgi:protein Tex